MVLLGILHIAVSQGCQGCLCGVLYMRAGKVEMPLWRLSRSSCN